MNNKITIIEGPTPEFETVRDPENGDVAHAWTSSILEGPYVYRIASTTLRTANGQALMQRCDNAWAQNETMFLVYKDRIGLTQNCPIIAARTEDTDEGDLLHLWVRMNADAEEDDDEVDEDDNDAEIDLF